MPKGRGLAVVMALLIGGAASTQERRNTNKPDLEAPSVAPRGDLARIAGEWSGTYTCNQGVTAMRLVIAPAGERRVKALMHFFAAPENPDVPEGCFTLTGTFDKANGAVDLGAERWIVQPTNYLMIDLDGDVDRDGSRLRGRVIGPNNSCKRFALTRAKAVRPLPEACAMAMK